MNDSVQSGFGVIALAAYRPDWTLFRRQLQSIRDQSHHDFSCLISADGGHDEITAFVEKTLKGDTRFKVIGFGERLGFYGNFERVLEHVPADANWVALSDQDDYWYPDKLETLLPYLKQYSLATGQARVVTETGTVLAESTNRQNVPPTHLLLDNQITGGLSVFRRDLLSTILPFPRLSNPSENHDHWIGLCAAVADGAYVVDNIVQDYVQHGGNVLGEPDRTFILGRSMDNLRNMGRRYEGGANSSALLRVMMNMKYGWSRCMVLELQERSPHLSPALQPLLEVVAPGKYWAKKLALLWSAVASKHVSLPSAATFAAGAVLTSLRRR
ncbi:glycosyltransferase [Arthrobacter sp. SLBN-122]|uniref:glycosyltransferase n=1 Tax=Arthrobacter sp. SLBN-122 TaxID=2768455 RepID=UPI00114E1ABA|nr:glycosyltransferase [Arthrobacter sp. SLBN-122]TQJ33075.1 glycosyl transferase family 2 [Arthrobacter sp. SLBN-122]